jgi:hypothetical protein
MPGVATNTLTARLEEMAAAGLIIRRRLPPPAARAVYELTPRGRSLEPVILAFARWGLEEIKAVHADPKREAALAPLRSSSLALALIAFFVPPAQRVSARVQLRLPTGELGLTVRDGALDLTYGSIESPDAEATLREDVVIGLAIGEVTLPSAIKHGRRQTARPSPCVETRSRLPPDGVTC